MKNYRYLIVGGGMTAAAAVEGIREVDADGTIAMIGAENHAPYRRPPLTKGLWAGKPVDSIWLNPDPNGVVYHLGRRVERLDTEKRFVVDDRGEAFGYERLLLATGGSPRRLPFESENVIYFRTLDDFQKLHSPPDPSEPVAVIGGGFIGAEIAAALAMNGRKVAMVFPEAGIGARVFPQDLSLFLNDYYREKGVEVYPGELVQGLELRGGQQALHTDSGREIRAGQVVAGLGILPNVALAQSAGLDIANGICVDEQLRTSRPEIYAAGDVAAFYSPALETRLRVEHADNATSMGKAAGRNMAGAAAPYQHLPFFYSDLFELGYEAVGDLDSRMEVVPDWQEPYRKGTLYYLKDGRVRGVLLWNVWDQVDAARRLIEAREPVHAQDLQSRLPA
jgi:NADPH-dependent 2,4-dienoyl-CoA reductase/sulfur reductase-like enzyme